MQDLEEKADEKGEILEKTRQELESIRSILESIDKSSERKITKLRDSIDTKESELGVLKLEIEALKACKKQLQDDLASTNRIAENLKENVHEKDKLISVYKRDNQKITEELVNLRQLASQNDLVARKEV
jgi:chromosome segregation ATPase